MLTKTRTISTTLDSFFSSDLYLIFELLISILAFCFKQEILGIVVIIVLVSINFAFCKNILPSFISFMFACIIPLGMYGTDWNDVKYVILGSAMILIFASICHLVVFPTKIKSGKLLFPMVAFSGALLIGGLGNISIENYFAPTALYYVIGLGPLMILFYLYFLSSIPDDTTESIDYFSKGMAYIGLMIILMWVFTLIEESPNYTEHFYIPYRQWKNNIGNYALLSMPFVFYRATKQNAVEHYIIGILMFACVILSQSRGASIMAILTLPFLVYNVFKHSNKKNVFGLIITSLCITIIACSFFVYNKDSIFSVLNTAIDHADSGRFKLYKEALNNFIKYPIVGAGIGYINEEIYPLKSMAMFWYHSTILQVLGSMGIIGLMAYTYQMVTRLKLLTKKNVFNCFALLSFLGFEGYSMINTGDFAPIPFVLILTFILSLCEKNNANTIINN